MPALERLAEHGCLSGVVPRADGKELKLIRTHCVPLGETVQEMIRTTLSLCAAPFPLRSQLAPLQAFVCKTQTGWLCRKVVTGLRIAYLGMLQGEAVVNLAPTSVLWTLQCWSLCNASLYSLDQDVCEPLRRSLHEPVYQIGGHCACSKLQRKGHRVVDRRKAV